MPPSLWHGAKDDSDSIFTALTALVVSFLTGTLNSAMAHRVLRAWDTWKDSGTTPGVATVPGRALGAPRASPEGDRQCWQPDLSRDLQAGGEG